MQGNVFDIQRFSIGDGPGIRTTVFMKGCPLQCLWCHNPESRDPEPELMYDESRCIGSRACVEVCPSGVHRFVENRHLFDRDLLDRDLCNGCRACAEECPSGALELVGKACTVDEVFDEIMRDEVFYRNSGGGVTLSGGEPTLQVEFATELLRRCKDEDLSTAIDTSGYASWDVFETLLPVTDLFLFDIKHMDPRKHKEHTGVSNQLILENLKNLSSRNAKIEIRVPVVPGYNDAEEEARSLGALVRELKKAVRIRLLPYHDFAVSKCNRLGKEYPVEPIELTRVEKSVAWFSRVLEEMEAEVVKDGE